MIGNKVHVIVDRPLGSRHPEYNDTIYEVNYGYVPGALGKDGEEQDAYILGVDEPLEEFNGEVIAIIQRKNDNETKWIVAHENMHFTDEEIIAKINFQEKYFDISVLKNL